MSARDLDRLLALRERIVWTLDAIDRDDPGAADFTLRGLLDDLDMAVSDNDEPEDEDT